MDHFLKRVPAFSRVYGCSDSEDESDIDDTDNCLDVSFDEDSFKVLLGERLYSNFVIGVGSFATAFFEIGFGLSDDTKLVSLNIDSKVFITIHYICFDGCGILLLLIQENSIIVTYKQKHTLSVVLKTIVSNNNQANCKEVSIISSTPSFQFLSNDVKPLPPYIRIFSTNRLDFLFRTLERPNIINGLSAELLAWFYYHSVSTTLYICYYLSQNNEICAWPAVKEIFNCYISLQSSISSLKYLCMNWDEMLDSDLKLSCTKMVCGNKSSKMDQMYT